MATRVVTLAFRGVEAVRVDVQVQFTRGEQKFFLVGMGDKAVSESRERVRGAFMGLGLALPSKRIIANYMAIASSQFSTLPKAPIEVRAVEAWRENTASGAFYNQPSPDGSRPACSIVGRCIPPGR